MAEVAKKISRKIRRVPEAKLIIEEEPFMAKLKNAEFEILRNGRPIDKLKPVFVCGSCEKEFNARWVRRKVSIHGITLRASYVNKRGDKNARLIEFTKKVKRKKFSATEAFAELDLIQNLYRDIPSNEKDIGSASSRIPLKCPECESPLGNIDVYVYPKPKHPALPDVKDYVALPKTVKELILIREYLQLPKDMDFDDWVAGKDLEGWKEKIGAWSNEIEKLRFLRTLQRPVSDLITAIRGTLEAIDHEIETRGSRVYNLIKEPPQPPKS